MKISNMKHHDDDEDEALNSPFSKIYLCPETEQIINCAMGLKYPINVGDLKTAFLNSIMIKHPRFSSLMLRNHAAEHWKKTQVNIDDHFVILHGIPAENDDLEATLNAYLADLSVSTPLSLKKPLWELHVLMGLNCVVLRVHHALGDGASLMSMLSACFGKKMDGGDEEREKKKKNGKAMWKESGIWGLVKTVWYTLVFALKFLGRLLWVKDETSVIYGGDGVELWPRKLETLKFDLLDFKSIKEFIPNATINDVLHGVISSGLSKYLHLKSPKALLHGLQITALVAVNLRRDARLQEIMRTNRWWGSPSWGNKTGMLIQPVGCCKGLHPMEHVKRMKLIMDRKKQSYEAHVPYIALHVIAFLLGRKMASWCTHRILCHTSMLISNIMGPSEEMAIAGNPITFLRVNISSLPQALTVHMVSYAGKADVQVMIAKDIITDSQLLAKCFQDSLLEMKNFTISGNMSI